MIWKKIITHINSHNIGDIIYRKNLKNYENHNNDTVDLYRYYLEKVGFLKTIYAGEYKVLHKIPNNLSSSKVRKASEFLTENNWTKWFVKNEDILKQLMKT